MNVRIQELSLVTSAELTAAYAVLSNDYNPLHVDAAFAATTAFGKPIAHGAMALNLLLNAIEATFGQPGGERLDVKFIAPVMVGERITAGGELTGEGYAVWVCKDDGTEVIRGTLRLQAA